MIIRVPALILRGLVFSFFVVSAAVSASEYSLGKSVNLRSNFTDNSGLSTTKKDERYGTTGALSLDLSRITEISRFSGALLLEVNSYNIKSYSTFDQRGNFDYTRANERGSWGFGGVYDSDSISSYEDTEQNFGIDSQIDTRVISQSLSANWNRQLNEKNLLAVNASLIDVDYESVSRGDYRYGQSNFLWQYFLTDRIRFQTNVTYSVFDPDNRLSFGVSPLFIDEIKAFNLPASEEEALIKNATIGFCQGIVIGAPWPCAEIFEADDRRGTLNLKLGIYYALTERLTLDFLYGESSVRSKLGKTYINLPSQSGDGGPRIENEVKDDDSEVYEASLRYSGERLLSTLSASRNESVNSDSRLSLNTKIALDAQFRLNSYHAVSSSIEWYRQENSGFSDAEFYDRDIASAKLSYKFEIFTDWSLISVYRLKYLSLARQTSHSLGNEIIFSIRWHPNKVSWSR